MTRTAPISLTAVALLAMGLPLLAGPTAQAADPAGSTELALVRVSGDVGSGVDVFAAPEGPRAPYAGFDVSVADRFLRSLEVSRSGDRTVAVEPAGAVDKVVVRDVSGGVVGTPVVGTAQAPTVFGAALSPDGTRVFWSQGANDDGFPSSVVLRSASVTGGGATQVATDLVVRDALDADRLLVTSSDVVNPALSVLSLSSGVRTPVTALDGRTVLGLEALSPDLTLALTRARGEGRTTLVQVSPVTLVGTALVLGPAVTLVTLQDNGSPFSGAGTFSRDGAEVWFVGSTPQGLFRVPVTGGTPTSLGTDVPGLLQTDVLSAVREQAAPAAPTSVGPAALAGTRATIPYALPADPTSSKVVFQRTSPGLPTVTRAAVAPLPLVDAGLVVGSTYTYRVFQVDRSGNAGAATTFRLTATAPPALTAGDPTSATSTTPDFPVRFAPPGNAGSTRYTVDARVVGRAPTRWATATPAVARVFGTLAVPPTVATTRVSEGQTYGFSGFAQDAFGNRTAVVSSSRVVVPFDDRLLNRRGRTATYALPGAFGGTSTVLLARGADVSVRLTGDRFQLIGERLPSTGAVDVFVDGRRAARVDTRAGSRRVRQVLWSASFATSRTAIVTVRAVGTPGRPTVLVDGFSQRARP